MKESERKDKINKFAEEILRKNFNREIIGYTKEIQISYFKSQ